MTGERNRIGTLNENPVRKEEYMMEKYVKPVMMLEEVEDEVYTDVATSNGTVTAATTVSGDVIEVTPNQPVQTLVDPTTGRA